MTDIVVSSTRNKLLSLISNEAYLLWSISEEVADMKDEQKFIQGHLEDADKKAAEDGGNTNEGLKTYVKKLREASFRIEDAIDEYNIYIEQQPHDAGCAALLSQIIHFIQTLVPRHRIASEIQQTKQFVDGIIERGKKHKLLKQLAEQRHGGSQLVQWHDPRQLSRVCDEVVGLEGPRDKLIGWLLEGPAKRTTISVVGMGGLGKSTLVGRVFDNEKVKAHFDSCAWIKVSPTYDQEELMKDLLTELCETKGGKDGKVCPDYISKMDLVSVIGKVKKHLQQKRYVVIFDDVWSIDLWDQFENVMHDSSNGSRILITTRRRDVVNSCMNSPFDHMYELQPLTFEKSMELFCKKVFHNECCPKELVDISSDFVKKCDGLPLAIVAIGGLLRGIKEKNSYELEKVRKSLSSEMEKNPHLRGITKILGFTYDDMRSNLKSCFLYFGIYPKEVKSIRLIRQWIAEGFIKDEEGKTLEDVAEEYLTELIGRSLVQVTSYTIDGKAKSCRVHDLLRDMILRKFKDLSFCQHISKKDGILSSKMIRRLSIAANSNDLMGNTERSHIRSLLVFAGNKLAEADKFVEEIPTKYRLLKVLDFEEAELDCVPENWGNLAHLKYLSLRYLWSDETKSLPKSFGKLRNLETLDIRNGPLSEIPEEICNLTNLRHLLGFQMKLFRLKNGLGGMTSLQTLSQVSVDHDEDELVNDDDVVELLKELGKLKQLRELGLVHLNEGLVSTLFLSINEMQDLEKLHIQSTGFDVNDFSALSSLPMLRKLKLEGKLNKFPEWVSQLQNLAKLTLRYSELTDDPLKWLQNMPHLLFLHISSVAYEGETLFFQKGGFQQLKELRLSNLFNLNSINIDKGALPSLEKLQFWGMPELKTIPPSIKHLEKLKVLDLIYMPDQFEECIVESEHPSIQHVPLVKISTGPRKRCIVH